MTTTIHTHANDGTGKPQCGAPADEPMGGIIDCSECRARLHGVPVHQRPQSCHVCGGEKHEDNADHRYWSNADAEVEVREHDARTTIRHSNGTTTPEANYVAEHRPY